MTDYILDMNTWRCGGDSENKLGDGTTKMLNSEGFMCCLGQFAKSMGVSEKRLLDAPEPDDVATVLRGARKKSLYDPNFVCRTSYGYENTSLAQNCIDINDDDTTTPSEKVKGLTRLLKAAGHTLTVIPLKQE